MKTGTVQDRPLDVFHDILCPDKLSSFILYLFLIDGMATSEALKG